MRLVGRAIVLAWLLVAVFAPWLAPYAPSHQFPDAAYARLRAAARFAAEALAGPDLDPGERVSIIRRLVPLASASATVLDTVLARLLIAARPAGATLRDIERIAGEFPEPPAAVRTAMIPA